MAKKIGMLVGDVIAACVKELNHGFFQSWMSEVVRFPLCWHELV